MPTLTEQLTTMLTELGVFNTSFEAFLAALEAMESNTVNHLLWVDPIGGDDTNDGLTSATALQTLQAATALTPPGSYVRLNLLNDYSLQAHLPTGGRVIRIGGVNTLGVATQRVLEQTVAGGEARRFVCQDGGAFHLNRLDIALAKTAITEGPAAFVSGRIKTLFLLDCGIDVEAGVTTVSVMGPDGVSILEVDTVTALDDAIAGSWIGGVSAGVNPNTLGKVLTNLATL